MWHGGEGSLQRGTGSAPSPFPPLHPPRLQQPSPLVSGCRAGQSGLLGTWVGVGLSEPL